MVALAFGCGDNLYPTFEDAGPAADGSPNADAQTILDAAAPLAWLDFSATGCTTGGGIACTGTAPLTVSFHALAPSAIDEYRWRFGDVAPEEPPIEDALPTHTFSMPGSYDVSLSASGPGGSNVAAKTGYVVVSAAPPGATCTIDTQCSVGECICAGETCPPQLSNGLCSERCPDDSCETGEVCADLRPSSQSEDWHDRLCLLDCESQSCPSGLSCQSLRSSPGPWVRGCLPSGILATIGSSCADETGFPDDEQCASSLCLSEGARGLCASECTTTAECPQGSACATFGGALAKKCIARCDETLTCDDDPWLACENPGFTADKGFTVDEVPNSGGYCAPKRCTAPTECGPNGACTDDYCAPIP